MKRLGELMIEVDRTQAVQIFDKATAMDFPSGGDIRKLDSSEKGVVELMRKLQGMAFKITPDRSWQMQKVKSRLAKMRAKGQE